MMKLYKITIETTSAKWDYYVEATNEKEARKVFSEYRKLLAENCKNECLLYYLYSCKEITDEAQINEITDNKKNFCFSKLEREYVSGENYRLKLRHIWTTAEQLCH